MGKISLHEQRQWKMAFTMLGKASEECGEAARAPGCGVHATAGKPLGGGREAARAGQMVGVPPGSTTTVMCSKLEAVPSARSLRSAALAAWVAITGVFAVVTENVIFAACKIAATSVSG
ncbi:unnamed protein product, partial [Prorocentrum cordatum]